MSYLERRSACITAAAGAAGRQTARATARAGFSARDMYPEAEHPRCSAERMMGARSISAVVLASAEVMMNRRPTPR